MSIHKNKRSLLIPVSFLYLGSIAQTPTSLPEVYNSSSPINYVRVWDAVKPESNANNITTSATPDQFKMTTQYFDGLGRPIQTVIKQGSLITGSTAVDMVNTVLYDDFGRVQYQYLPSPANSTGGNNHISDGLFKLNPFQQQAAFYDNTNPNNPIKGQGESFFYGQTKYEASPLNRVEEAFAPGNSWMGSSANANESDRKSIKTKYWINTTTDGVRIWKVANNATMGSFGSYSSPGAYPAGELYKNVTVDENGKQAIEFKDKEGLVILKKVQLTATADNGTGSGHTGWLCTYYIYDDLNQLRCVIQPRGVELIASNWILTDATILAEQCFRYEYDQRQRMIVKKVPGAGEVNMVYDKRDRLVMTQDANLKLNNQWLVTKYDELNRPVETGIWTNATTAAIHRTNAAATYPYPATSGNYELLTTTHYDNYTGLPAPLTNYLSTWNSNFSSTDNNSYPYPQMPAASNATRGMVTWTSTKVLGTSTYLYAVSYYDDKGRIIQMQSTNITGGTDVVTTQYGWQGLPLVTVAKTYQGTSQTTLIVVTKNSYDILGRLVKTEKKQSYNLVNGGAMSAYSIISEMEYDALGQVIKKKLGAAPLETMKYDYNIRGWLLGANRDYVKDVATANYFGFDLGYDKDGILGIYTKQYNGNIGGMIWKSKGDGEKRKYDFSYDAVNRITGAAFNQYVSGSGTSAIFNKTAGVDFTLSNMTYDANGNIMTMNQNGLKINTSPLIDQLSYTYQTNSNKLSKVLDAVVDKDSKLGDFKYDPATKQSTDYAYDANGNLTKDNNKSISSITYNYLNLPSVITITGKGTITYTYDAAGNKLKKVTQENNATVPFNGINYTTNITTTTSYIGGSVYESKVYSHSALTSLQYTDELQFIGHEEGRIRPVRDASNNITGFVYDYFIKDHLGNVRMVLTEEQKQDLYPMASLEPSKVATEENYYDIQTGNIVDKSAATGITDYANNNGISNNPSDPSFEATNSSKLYSLNSAGTKMGLGITLKVMAGDKIDVFGKSYYFQNTSSTSGNSPIAVLDLLAAFLGSPSSPLSAHGLTATDLNTPSGILGIQSLITNQESQSNANPAKPRAFINVIFFDEQFRSYDFRISMAGSNSIVKDHYSELQNITAGKSGYVYIYCSNESTVEVFFDNLQIVHTRGRILEETHYYPFGLTMAGISSKALQFGGAENKIKFQGQEFAHAEFSDGSGLEMYKFKYRMHDPQIGRFWQIDPLADKYVYNSTYAFSENKVTTHVELEGLESIRFDASKYPDRGESTQIKKPIACLTCRVVEATPIVTLTVTKGKQAGLKVGGFGAEINAGSREVLKVTDADPGTNTADKNKKITSAGISIGIVSASKESATKSTTGKNEFGSTITNTTTETTRNLTLGLKNTPLSMGVQNTETTTSVSNGYMTYGTTSTSTGPQVFLSATPSETEHTTPKGTTFSLSLYFKIEFNVDFKQLGRSILNSLNTGH